MVNELYRGLRTLAVYVPMVYALASCISISDPKPKPIELSIMRNSEEVSYGISPEGEPHFSCTFDRGVNRGSTYEKPPADFNRNDIISFSSWDTLDGKYKSYDKAYQDQRVEIFRKGIAGETGKKCLSLRTTIEEYLESRDIKIDRGRFHWYINK